MKTKKFLILAFEFCPLYCYYDKHHGHIPLLPPDQIYYRPKSNYIQKERHFIPQPAASCIFKTFFSLICEQTAGEREGEEIKGRACMDSKGIIKWLPHKVHWAPVLKLSAMCQSSTADWLTHSCRILEIGLQYFGNLPIVRRSRPITEFEHNEIACPSVKLFKAGNTWLP